jgi:iron complex outermembrane receptor protein
MSEEGLVFAKIGSDNFRSTGFRKGYKEGDFSLFTDLYYQEHDKKVYSNSDAFNSGVYSYQTPFYTIDNRPLSSSTDVPLWLQNYSLGLSMQYKEFSFKGRVYQYEHGASFGFNYIVPQDNDFLEFPNHYGEFAYTKEFGKFKLVAKAGMKYNGIEAETKLISDGVILPQSSNPTQVVVFPDGVYGEHEAKQRSLYHGVDIYYDGIAQHQISGGYYLSKIDTTKVISKITNRDTGNGLVDYTDTLPFFDKDASRETYIFTLADKYNYSDALQLLTSISYENNTHIDAQINPKLSLVYQTEKDNIFKMLYASSHRTPSWQELYTLNNRARVGNNALEAERIHTFEGAYIKHFSHDSFIQTTLFYLINQNQIHNITENNQYINNDEDNHLYGAEVEYKGKLTPHDSIYLNLSYINGENSYDQTLSQVSHLLLKGYYIYNLQENLSLSTVIKHSAPKHRVSYDNRDDIAGATVIDSTLSFYDYTDHYRISLGVKNIFDKNFAYMSKPYTYEEDYSIPGRSFVLSFSKEF